uniref:Uncharacterized protein n=1 Tax=Aegilops tauschii subsp. strangulata TaxID=200361 RepID=A0A453TCK7_AEGTS
RDLTPTPLWTSSPHDIHPAATTHARQFLAGHALRRALPSPASWRAILPAASSRLLSVTASTQQNTADTAIDLSNDESRRRLVNRCVSSITPSSLRPLGQQERFADWEAAYTCVRAV